MTAPKGMGPAGKALWKAVHGDLPQGWELDQREAKLLAMAARQADDIDALEQSIKKIGVMVAGSQGQSVLNPAIGEVRQGRHAVARLLGALELPDADEQPATAATARSRKAAQARWGRKEQLEAMRNG